MWLHKGIAPPCRPDDGLVKALARALHWKRALESGHCAAIAKLAAMEGNSHLLS